MSLKLDDIKINKEYAKLIPPLSKEEYAQLKSSIRTNGLYLTIVINENNTILDGHHRFKACNELEIQAKYKVKKFESKLAEKKFVILVNLDRRHLIDYQKGLLAKELLKIEQEEAKGRQEESGEFGKEGGRGNKKPSSTPLPKGLPDNRAMSITAKKVGLKSGEQLRKILKIEDQAPEEVKQKLRDGNTTINKEYNKIQKVEKKKIRQEEIKKIQVNLPDTITLYNQEFQTAPIQENSVSLIFTDPPYGEDALPLVRDLLHHAEKVLKEGGSLIFYPGQAHIDKVFEFAKETSLTYHWIIAVIHSGPGSSIFGRKVLAEYKPMLWFTNGKYEGEFVRDLIKSEYQGKELHEWAQSTIESDYYIKYMTIENEIVYDPFMGSGTFGVSAKKLNRQFIGCEVNPEHFANAERMISDE